MSATSSPSDPHCFLTASTAVSDADVTPWSTVLIAATAASASAAAGTPRIVALHTVAHSAHIVAVKWLGVNEPC